MRIRINRILFKTELNKRDITQTALSKSTGLSKATINSVANGKTCSLETGQKIADALKINLEDILQEV